MPRATGREVEETVPRQVGDEVEAARATLQRAQRASVLNRRGLMRMGSHHPQRYPSPADGLGAGAPTTEN